MQPCIRSDTVGSAVAALLIANLVGHRDDSREIFQHAVTGMCAALDAAFNGDEYAERKWGPGPVTKGTYKMCVRVRVRARARVCVCLRGTSSLALEYFKWVYADRALSVMPTLTLLLSVTLYSAACRMSSQPKTERVCLYYRCGQQQGVGVRAEPDAAVCCHH